MGDREREEKVPPQFAGRDLSSRRKYSGTATRPSTTGPTAYHSGGKDGGMEIGVRYTNEPEQGTPGTRLRGKTHQGWRHAPEDDKPGDEGFDPTNRGAPEEAGEVHPDGAADQESKVCNHKCSKSNSRFLFSGNLRIHRREENQQRRREDQSRPIYVHPDPTNRDKSPVLQTNADTKICTRTGTMFQMPPMESHHKGMQISSEVLLLRKTRSKGRPSPLRLLQKAGATEMYKLPGKPQPSLQRMPLKNQYDLHHTRADGARTASEDNQPRSTDSNQNNSGTMEGGNISHTTTSNNSPTSDPGTMEDSPATTASMEGDTACTKASMPTTISLPTTSPTRQKDYSPGVKETSTSNNGEICHHNGHCNPGPYEPPHEDSGHNKRAHQSSSQGIIQEGTGGPNSSRKKNPSRSDAPLGPGQCYNLLRNDS